ncbi:MAG: TonB C-terminal domain-containing protein, partial [Gammaproteobacteria bacterium]|nr:TonB C-terminal domain-containing protein [Gammaproteobacteria bacterium]
EQKKAAEAKRLAELKKRKEQEQAAIDRQRLASLEQEEAELNAEAQRVLRARERSRLIAEYQDAIRNKIERNWRKPLDYQADDQCRVLVLQSLGGVVNDVVVENCTGNDEFRDSVEKAVWKADPLPEPPAPELFDREVLFTFSPKSS